MGTNFLYPNFIHVVPCATWSVNGLTTLSYTLGVCGWTWFNSANGGVLRRCLDSLFLYIWMGGNFLGHLESTNLFQEHSGSYLFVAQQLPQKIASNSEQVSCVGKSKDLLWNNRKFHTFPATRTLCFQICWHRRQNHLKTNRLVKGDSLIWFLLFHRDSWIFGDFIL